MHKLLYTCLAEERTQVFVVEWAELKYYMMMVGQPIEFCLKIGPKLNRLISQESPNKHNSSPPASSGLVQLTIWLKFLNQIRKHVSDWLDRLNQAVRSIFLYIDDVNSHKRKQNVIEHFQVNKMDSRVQLSSCTEITGYFSSYKGHQFVNKWEHTLRLWYDLKVHASSIQRFNPLRIDSVLKVETHLKPHDTKE